MRRAAAIGWLSLLGAGVACETAYADEPVPAQGRLQVAVSAAMTCPKERTPEEIVVCGEREENRRYRVDSARVPELGTRASQNTSRERHALLDYDAGGTGTCSNVGAWGAWGCMNKQWKADQEQAAGSKIKGSILYTPDY